MKQDSYCEICGKEIEIQRCCDGYMCGCMGMPIEPPVCSEECMEKYAENIKNKVKEIKTKSNLKFTKLKNKNMDEIKCTKCGWVGLEIELGYDEYDAYNLSDPTGYMCPKCGHDDFDMISFE